MLRYRNVRAPSAEVGGQALAVHQARAVCVAVGDWLTHWHETRGAVTHPPPLPETFAEAWELLLDTYPRQEEWLAELARREQARRDAELHRLDAARDRRRQRRNLAQRVRRGRARRQAGDGRPPDPRA